MPGITNKTMTCYTYSVRPIILESRNLKVKVKKLEEEENEDFCEEEYFNFILRILFSAKKKTLNFFALDGVFFIFFDGDIEPLVKNEPKKVLTLKSRFLRKTGTIALFCRF